MIEFVNVTKRYDDTGITALNNVSFKIEKGEFVFVVGETGAGKTTLTRLLLKEECFDNGRIYIDGEDISKIKRRKTPYYRRKIGMVFQDFGLISQLTVFENVALAMEAVGTSRRDINNMVPQILSLVGLSQYANSKPDRLSGGEKQRVAMARAMANNPPILIADEPTGNLDPRSSAEITKLFKRFNDMGTTVLIITHAREIVNDMKKRVIQLENGRVIRDEMRGGYLYGESVLFDKTRL